MRNFWQLFCILIICLVFRTPFALAGDQKVTSVEIVADGKKYNSLRDYRLEQITKILNRALSASDLKEFTNDELLAVLTEVRKLQNIPSPPKPLPESSDPIETQPNQSPQLNSSADRQDTVQGQMEEMLEKYHKTHKYVNPLTIDPNKVKSIIIQPKLNE